MFNRCIGGASHRAHTGVNYGQKIFFGNGFTGCFVGSNGMHTNVSGSGNAGWLL